MYSRARRLGRSIKVVPRLTVTYHSVSAWRTEVAWTETKKVDMDLCAADLREP